MPRLAGAGFSLFRTACRACSPRATNESVVWSPLNWCPPNSKTQIDYVWSPKERKFQSGAGQAVSSGPRLDRVHKLGEPWGWIKSSKSLEVEKPLNQAWANPCSADGGRVVREHAWGGLGWLSWSSSPTGRNGKFARWMKFSTQAVPCKGLIWGGSALAKFISGSILRKARS